MRHGRAAPKAIAVLVAYGITASLHAEADACDLTVAGRHAKTFTLKHLHLAAVAKPDPITVGKPFVLEIATCWLGEVAAADITIQVDATMPEHNHGMNYQPRVLTLVDGRYRAEGLMFHMPGRWQIAIEVAVAGKKELLTWDIALP